MAWSTRIGIVWCNECDEFAFVRDAEWVEAEQTAGGTHFRGMGNAGSSSRIPTPAASAISFSVAATPPLVGSRIM